MQTFDFHINPGKNRNDVVKTFFFPPESPEQEALGTLYIIGELVDAVSRDKNILKKLSEIIRNEYFFSPERSPEIALKESLKKGNSYLQKLSDQGNVRWLGKLNIAVLSVDNFTINFSKAGRIKMILLRGGEYLDVSENLEFQGSLNSSSIKVFSNAASGRLSREDKIVVLTQGIDGFFEGFLAEKIITLFPFNQKTLNKLIKSRKKYMKRFSGALFLIYADIKRKRRFLRVPRFGLPAISIKVHRQIILVIVFILLLLVSYFIFKR
jgi:hypothetical protein